MPNTNKLSKENALLGEMQKAFQLAIMKVMAEFGNKAGRANLDLAIGDAAIMLGSGAASAIYETLRDQGQISGLTEDQKKALTIVRSDFLNGFDEKVEIIKDPSAMQKITGVSAPGSSAPQ